MQCTMLQVPLTRVALLVVLRALYGVAGCACWMFGVKGLIVLLFMLGLGMLLGIILCVVDILQRLLSLI